MLKAKKQYQSTNIICNSSSSSSSCCCMYCEWVWIL